MELGVVAKLLTTVQIGCRKEELARKRDHYTCQRCGIAEIEYGQELSVHHIDSVFYN